MDWFTALEVLANLAQVIALLYDIWKERHDHDSTATDDEG